MSPTLTSLEADSYTSFLTSLPEIFISRTRAFYTLGRSAWLVEIVYDNVSSSNIITDPEFLNKMRTCIWFRKNYGSFNDVFSFNVHVYGTWK